MMNNALRFAARAARVVLRGYPLRLAQGKLIRFAMNNVRGVALARDDFGRPWLLVLDNYIDACIYLRGSFEKELLKGFAAHAQRGGCEAFIDVGANIGVYSVHFAQQPAIKRVYAFEPDPRNHAQLMAEMLLNNVEQKIEAFNCALSDDNGDATLYLGCRAEDGLRQQNNGTSSLSFNALRHDVASARVVRKAKLDDLLDFAGRKIAIKIDVEGHEQSVLRGMTRTLLENECVVMVESFPERFAGVKQHLEDCGYARSEHFNVADNYIFEKLHAHS